MEKSNRPRRGARGPADFGVVVSPGAQTFLSHCAPCHGRLGRGDGPAAAALRTRPVDLSRLAANNGGTFPTKRVEAVLRFGVAPAAHGSTDMPAWGPLFTAADGDAVASQRIADLLRHLEGLRR